MSTLILPFLAHPNYGTAYDELFIAVNFSLPGTLILMVGPSGAGKTTMRRRLEKEYLGDRPSVPVGHLPLVSLKVVNADKGFFSPRDFARRLLEKLGDPFRGEAPSPQSGATYRIATTEMDMWAAAEALAKARQVKAIFLDEANLLCLTSRTRSSSDYLERLKVFAEETGVVLVLFATYDFLKVWNHSAQLNRRMITIHLRPYSSKIRDDVCSMRGILGDWSTCLPLSAPNLLNVYCRDITHSTFGSVGEVASFLWRAELSRLARKSLQLEPRDIEAALPALVQRSRGQLEIENGARLLTKCTLIAKPAKPCTPEASSGKPTARAPGKFGAKRKRRVPKPRARKVLSGRS